MGKRRGTASDFPVDTNGHCFICLNKALLEYKRNESGLVSANPYSSLHSLSQYLKMDMTKVFHEKDSIPSDLLDSVQSSRLKVSSCNRCAGLNNKITALCRKLDKIETEVGFYLELIRDSFLLGSNEDDTARLHSNTTTMGDDHVGLLEKGRIVKALRSEAKQRCFQKLSGVQPRVKVRNLTSSQVYSIEQKNKSKAPKNETPTHFFHSPTNPREYSGYIKNEDFGTDAIDYFEDNDDALDGEYEDESNNSVHHLHHTGSPPSITQTEAVAVKRRKWDNNTTVEDSSTTVLPPNSSIKVEKLTFVINPETGKFKCNVCSGEFTQRDKLKRHYDSVHLKIKHKCNLCGKEFSRQEHYKTHHKIAHVGVRFKCNFCGKCFTEKRSLIAHQQSIHQGK